MSFESGFVALLLGQPSVVTLIGDRVMPAPLDEGATLPALTYQVINAGTTVAHDGDLNLDPVQVQLDIWASTKTEATAVRDAIFSINGFRGQAGGEQFDGVIIQNYFDNPEPDLNEHRITMEMFVNHRRQ